MKNNTAIGDSSLYANTSGYGNTAIGQASLNANTTGSYNAALGLNSLASNTTGVNNTALGSGALYSSITATDNTAVGYQSMATNTTGIENVAVGSKSLTSNTTGIQNTAVGYVALTANTVGVNNTAVGSYSLNSNVSGGYNTAVGQGSLVNNTSGSGNSVLGYLAMQYNTSGTANVAIGNSALKLNTTGGNNTALGTSALIGNTVGSGNVAIGYGSLGANTTGSNNVVIGSQVGGITLNGGQGNILIGTSYNVDTPSATTSNFLNIGNILGADMTYVSGSPGGNNQATLFLQSVAGGVDYTVITESTSAAHTVTISGAGADTNVSISLAAKNAGSVMVAANTAPAALDVSANNSSILLPTGTTAQRPTASPGMIRYNSSTPGLEAYYSGAWQALAGGAAGMSSNLGTTAAATNPQRSGEPGTGFYTAATGKVDVAASGTGIAEFSSTGENLIVTNGAYAINSENVVAVVPVTGDPDNLSLAIGQSALVNDNTSVSNGGDDTAGSENTAVGQEAMYANTGGTENTAVGAAALQNNTTGNENAAFGAVALNLNTVGSQNTALGNSALQQNTYGNGNTGIGASALAASWSNSYTASYNTAVGAYAMWTTTSGSYNTAIGYNADYSATTATGNVALGYDAMYSNTTGSSNVAVGYQAMSAVTIGSSNTALGYSSLGAVTTGANNVAIGSSALGLLTTGASNVVIGPAVASTILTTGSSNILIGTSANVTTLAAGTSNNLNIGNVLQGDTTYSTALGTEALYLKSTSASVDYVQIAGAVTGIPSPVISAQGTDTNVSVELLPKGTGGIGIGTNAPQALLHVAGTGQVDQQLYLGNIANFSGQLMVGNDALAATPPTNPFIAGTNAGNLAISAGGGLISIRSPLTTLDSGHSILVSGQTGQSQPLFIIQDGSGQSVDLQRWLASSGAVLSVMSATGNLGIGSSSPVASLDISQKTDAVALPTGTTAQRPTATPGMLRYNSSTPGIEAYYSGAWQALTSGTGTTSTTLGTSAAATSPQRSGDAATGFYSNVASTVEVAANGIEVEQWNTLVTGVDYLSITPGKSGTAPKIAVAGTTSPQSLNFAPNGAKGVLQFAGSTMFWQDNSNFNLLEGASGLLTTLAQTGGGFNGQYNTAIGYQALNVNTTGYENLAIGPLTLAANTTGIQNVAIGEGALNVNTTGYDNTAVGVQALVSNTTGVSNTAVGEQALAANTFANANTAVGHAALHASTGSNNTAIGDSALYANTTGIQNTAIGQNALALNTTGSSNMAVGGLAANTSGNNNTAVGAGSLNSTSGSNNVAIGSLVASTMLTTGSSNILIGTSAAVTTVAATTSSNLNIGNLLQGDMTYSTALGRESLYLQSTSASVDYLQIAGGATGSPGTVTISGQGTDTNVDIELLAKGTGNVGIGTSTPFAALEVTGGTMNPQADLEIARFSGAISSSAGAAVEVGINNTYAGINTAGLVFENQGTGIWEIDTNKTSGFLVYDYTAGQTRLQINSAGNVGIGSTSPVASLDLSQKIDAVALPTGTTAQRPTAVNGMIRYNSSTPGIEAYYSGAWQALTSGTGSASTTLGTSAAATSPQRTGDAATGFYSNVASTVEVAANGIEVEQWNTLVTGVDYLSITPGKSGTAPKIAVAGTTSPQSLNFAPNGAQGVLQFSGNTMFWQDNTNQNTLVGSTAGNASLSQTGGGHNGQGDVGLGYQALNANTTGFWNTAVGDTALQVNTVGLGNTAVGFGALSLNTIGGSNTALGSKALSGMQTGSNNTALGANTLTSAFGGTSGNTAVGTNALQVVTTGANNVALGLNTLGLITSGASNTALGTAVASTVLTTGSNNILIGTSAAVTTIAAGTTSNLNIGNLLQGDMTNSTGLGTEALYLQSTVSSVDYLQVAGGATGSPGVVTISGQGTDTNVSVELLTKGTGGVTIGTTAALGTGLTVNGTTWSTAFTATSDARLKKNIVPVEDALARVQKLRGVTFDWKQPSEREIGQDLKLETDQKQMGVIAQEVEAVFPEAVSTGSNGVKSVNYNSLVAPLIQSIKLQQEEISDLKRQTTELKSGSHSDGSAPFNGWMIVALVGIVGISGSLVFLGLSLRRRP